MRRIVGGAKRRVGKAKRVAIGNWEQKKSLRQFRKVNIRADLQLMSVGSRNMVSRIDPHLNLPRVTQQSAAAVRTAFVTSDIPFFELYSAEWEQSTLHVLEPRRAEIISAVKRAGSLSHWYFQELDRRGARIGLPLPVSTLDAKKQYAGLVLYERICSDLQARLVSTPRQGVGVHFWLPVEIPLDEDAATISETQLEAEGLTSEASVTATKYFDESERQQRYQHESNEPFDENLSKNQSEPATESDVLTDAFPVRLPEKFEPVIESLVWNGCATQLPDPLMRQDEYLAALTEAQHPSVTDVAFPIDVVYMWVDGSDIEWQKRKAQALGVTDTSTLAHQATASARFQDHDELRYSFRSISQYAPWIRKIWIVTDKQVPKWLDTDNPGVEVVDHREIWPDSKGIPTFNSHAIESNLHRIPGLAENYLIFNDDVFLARPVRPNTFFHANGIGSVFFSRALVEFGEHSPVDNVSTTAAKNARKLLSDAGHPTFSRKFYHTPLPIRKSVMREIEAQFSDDFAKTRTSQFRAKTDIAASGSVYFNYALATGAAVPGRIAYDYVDPGIPEGRRRLLRLMRKRNVDTFVINDGATTEPKYSMENTKEFIQKHLREYFPIPSEFEDPMRANDWERR